MPRHDRGAGDVDASLVIAHDFPGANILVEETTPDAGRVDVRQDRRDSVITWSADLADWFYWYFEVTARRAGRVQFRFTGSATIGPLGPGVSSDGGVTWRWLGDDAVDGNSFTYEFQTGESVRFSNAMPYLPSDLDRFLSGPAGARFELTSLCRTRRDHEAPLVRSRARSAARDPVVLVTCRHHASEMMGNYVIEGLLESVAAGAPHELLVVPFVDYDGVVDGDPGKNRQPHDHNRDYGNWIYPETRAVRDLIEEVAGERPFIHLDLHDPLLVPRGRCNDRILMVRSELPRIERAQRAFADLLESRAIGSLPYFADNDLQWGEAYNQAAIISEGEGTTATRWSSRQPACLFSATMEIPYAVTQGVTVDQESSRSFGRAVASALAEYATTAISQA